MQFIPNWRRELKRLWSMRVAVSSLTNYVNRSKVSCMVKALKTALSAATAFISAHPGYVLALWTLSVLTALAV